MDVSTLFPTLLLRICPCPNGGGGGGNSTKNLFFFFSGHSKSSSSLLLQSPRRRFPAVSFARRRKTTPATPKTDHSKHKPMVLVDDVGDDDVEVLEDDLGLEDELNEDAFEALFSQLEKDLKNDDLSDDGSDDEITEEDLAELEKELADALGDDDHDETPDNSQMNAETTGEEDEEEERPKLKSWQVRRLAHALKIGRRKTSIKNLAAELGLDRAFVLELLRDPPPNILLLSASLPDKVIDSPPEPVDGMIACQSNLTTDVVEQEPEGRAPVHVRQTRWYMQKRLKKVQVQTLERVYLRTKRPTNSMISSIVHVTNLPWRRVVKWFEDKRLQDGIPEHCLPFRRSIHETISTS